MQGLRDDGWEVTLLYSDGFRAVAPLLAGPRQIIPLSMTKIVAPLVDLKGPLAASYGEINAVVEFLRGREFDLAVNITHSKYSAGLMKLNRAKRTLGMSLDGRGNRVVKGAWGNYYFNSILNRGFNSFNLVDIHRLTGEIERPYPVKLNLPRGAVEAAEKLLAELNPAEKIVGFVPGASTPEKRLPVESFAGAARMAQAARAFRAVIVGASNEADLCERLAAEIPGALNLCGKTDVPTLAAVVRRLDLLVSNDTGPMHIAAAVGTKVLDVTLGSAMAAESAPYGEGHIVVEAKLGCFPCLPKLRCAHLSCQKMIPADLVGELIASELTGERGRADPVPGAAVYQTAFDDEGFLDLIPVQPVEATRATLLNRLYRELWKRELYRKDKVGSKTAFDLRRFFSASPATPETSVLCEEMRKLGLVAAIGRDAAKRIASLAMSQGNIAEIKRLGVTLKEADEGIAKLAYARLEMMPLAAQFTYAKEELTSTDLRELASASGRIYGDLARWCETLPLWIEELQKPRC